LVGELEFPLFAVGATPRLIYVHIVLSRLHVGRVRTSVYAVGMPE